MGKTTTLVMALIYCSSVNELIWWEKKIQKIKNKNPTMTAFLILCSLENNRESQWFKNIFTIKICFLTGDDNENGKSFWLSYHKYKWCGSSGLCDEYEMKSLNLKIYKKEGKHTLQFNI